MMLENHPTDPLMKISYHSYVRNGTPMQEYHVDSHLSFCNLVNPDKKQFGGNLSVRKCSDTKPLLMIGQDETVVSQFSFSSSAWIGSNGASLLLPKSQGESLLCTAFASRSFGLGRYLSPEELETRNKFRTDTRPNYISTKSAIRVHGKGEKPNLTSESNPFLKYFQPGNDKDGYWNFDLMALQLEDLCDCLIVLYTNHHFLIYFDQSSGHCKKQDNGLRVTEMNMNWGGVQPTIETQ